MLSTSGAIVFWIQHAPQQLLRRIAVTRNGRWTLFSALIIEPFDTAAASSTAAAVVASLQGGYDPRYPNMLPAGAGTNQGPGPAASSTGYAARYSGHLNTHPTRNAVWLGNRSQYVLSGADDGSLWVWDAASTQVVNIVKGGSSAIRKVQVSTQTAGNSPQLAMPVFCTPDR